MKNNFLHRKLVVVIKNLEFIFRFLDFLCEVWVHSVYVYSPEFCIKPTSLFGVFQERLFLEIDSVHGPNRPFLTSTCDRRLSHSSMGGPTISAEPCPLPFPCLYLSLGFLSRFHEPSYSVKVQLLQNLVNS